MLDVPTPTKAGESVELSCIYDLEKDKLYSVKVSRSFFSKEDELKTLKIFRTFNIHYEISHSLSFFLVV